MNTKRQTPKLDLSGAPSMVEVKDRLAEPTNGRLTGNSYTMKNILIISAGAGLAWRPPNPRRLPVPRLPREPQKHYIIRESYA